MSYSTDPVIIGSLLGRVCKLHYARVHARLEAVGLHRGQTPALHALWEKEGLTHSELAGRMHVQPATITRMIERMERAGFVERRPDPADRRLSRVYLTDAARDVRDDVHRILDLLAEMTFAGFGETELDQFRSYLERVRDNLVAAEDIWPDTSLGTLKEKE